MKDPLPRNYDAWRTRSPEDEEEERAERWRREQAAIDRADEERDRKKDEPKK
jgi:hypothetical protein